MIVELVLVDTDDACQVVGTCCSWLGVKLEHKIVMNFRVDHIGEVDGLDFGIGGQLDSQPPIHIIKASVDNIKVKIISSGSKATHEYGNSIFGVVGDLP